MPQLFNLRKTIYYCKKFVDQSTRAVYKNKNQAEVEEKLEIILYVLLFNV